jgi:UPF0755 protein
MKKLFSSLLFVCAIFAALILIVWSQVKPPTGKPYPVSFEIKSGQSLFSISEQLYEENIIRSKRIFEILMISLGSDRHVSFGEFYFERPLSVIEVAFRISGKEFGVEKVRVTFPEGFSTKEMMMRLESALPAFDKAKFEALVEKEEGYLFPDTYSFFPSVREEFIVETLKQNFTKKISQLEDEIAASGRTKEEIIIMASLLEKEARGENDNRIIAGILWKRLDKGMRLQVDAPFIYLLGKESSELTRADLQIDSPFNTYRYEGLPPSPINNPGLDTIKAALNPQESPYLFYLHDSQGNVYYGRTYAEHLQNIKKHLR